MPRCAPLPSAVRPLPGAGRDGEAEMRALARERYFFFGAAFFFAAGFLATAAFFAGAFLAAGLRVAVLTNVILLRHAEPRIDSRAIYSSPEYRLRSR